MPQLLLGFSIDGTPTAVYPMTQGDPFSATYDKKAGKPFLYTTNLAALPRTTYIDTLPTELLLKCFELAVNAPAPLTQHHSRLSDVEDANFALHRQICASAWSITLTCTRFRAIAMPILYSRIQLMSPASKHGYQAQDHRVSVRFVRTMNTAPATREHIKSLIISTQHFSQIKPIRGFEGLDFTRLGKVSLSVAHAWSTRDWEACCTTLRNLPVLFELLVDLRHRCKNDFRPFLHILGQLPNLSILTLDSVSGDNSSHDVFNWGSDRRDFGFDQGKLPSQVGQGRWCSIPKLTLIAVPSWLCILHTASLAVFWPQQPYRTWRITFLIFIP